MIAGFILILARDRIKSKVMTVVLALMASTYIAGAVVVATVGGTEDDDNSRRETPSTLAKTPEE